MEDKIFSVTDAGFEELALEQFHFQYRTNKIYQSWVDLLGISAASVCRLNQIPYLPISFFRSGEVVSTSFTPEIIFESSGTTGDTGSRHFVRNLELYKRSFLEGFKLFYGSPSKYCILGLLPSYLERSNSSLVMMVKELISESGNAFSGFYLYDHEKLKERLIQLEDQQQPTILIGVTYALLDFAEKYELSLKNTIVMETGGMKGRRREMLRNEVHGILKKQLGVHDVHSEYGMTELLSQAYSKSEGKFRTPGWMKVLVRDPEDPLEILSSLGGSEMVKGAINVIDLSNFYSCSFIATDDLGTILQDGLFTVDGRLDNADLRGCSLLTI